MRCLELLPRICHQRNGVPVETTPLCRILVKSDVGRLERWSVARCRTVVRQYPPIDNYHHRTRYTKPNLLYYTKSTPQYHITIQPHPKPPPQSDIHSNSRIRSMILFPVSLPMPNGTGKYGRGSPAYTSMVCSVCLPASLSILRSHSPTVCILDAVCVVCCAGTRGYVRAWRGARGLPLSWFMPFGRGIVASGRYVYIISAETKNGAEIESEKKFEKIRK